MKQSTIRFIDEKAVGVCQHDGSTWALCPAVAIRLPSWYPIPNVRKNSDTFIQKMIDFDQKGYDAWLMEYTPNTEFLKSQKNINLTINDQYSVQAKYVRLFDWRTDAQFRVNIKTGLIYVYESVTDTLIGLILPVKKKKEVKENDSSVED